jgi:hypothetical protein
MTIKDEFKYHIIRWTPEEILFGSKMLDDGSTYDLKNGFHTPSITKLDVISWINGNRFTDFSTVYQFNYNHKPMNGVQLDIEKTLKDDIFYYYKEQNYFKMSKRIFALSRYNGDEETINKLSPMFNGDLGRIYQVYGDINTIIYLVENEDELPSDRLRFEEDQFKNRLSNITIPIYLNQRHHILSIINKLENIHNHNRSKMLKELRELKTILEHILKVESEKHLKSIHFFPISNKFLP